MPLFHCGFGSGEYSVPVWSTLTFQGSSRMKSIAICEIMDKNKKAETARVDWLLHTRASSRQRCCSLQFCCCIQVLKYDCHKSSGVISQLCSRAEASGAGTMGCCVRRRSRRSDPEWSGCWHCVTLVWKYSAPCAPASVCSWVVSWGSELSHRHQPLTYCHQSLCTSRKNDSIAGCLF